MIQYECIPQTQLQDFDSLNATIEATVWLFGQLAADTAQTAHSLLHSLPHNPRLNPPVFKSNPPPVTSLH